MNEDNRIVIRRVTRNRRTGAPEEEILFGSGRRGAGGRWLSYLFLVPVFIVMAVLGIFFFTAFLALFAVVAAGLGFRLWWLRRKLRKSMEEEEGEYAVIEDAEIVEERTGKVNKTRDHQHNERQ
jgi:apolipoprotein N-acyltransferase